MVRTGLLVLVLSVGTARADDIRSDPDHPEDCPTPNGVVGHRRCPRFGSWAEPLEGPLISATIGAHVRVLPSRLAPVATARSVTPPRTPSGDSTTSYTVVERATVTFAGVLYLGAEAEIGLGVNPQPNGRSVAAGGLLLVGVHAGNRLFNVGGEIGGGGRVFDQTSGSSDLPAGEGVLEARVRADIWLSPWVTVGAVVGTSLLGRDEWMAGACIGFHSWAYGGRM